MARSFAFLPLVALVACGGDDGGPSFAADHPRIYLAANRARLEASLAENGPAAARFREIVDLQLGGSDIYGFEAWNAALLGQLTGEPQYCAYAVATVDAVVAAEEALIAAGERAEVSNDSYLHVGPTINDVMLTYDWCFDVATSSQKARWLAYAHQAVWNVWHPAEASWGGVAFEWSGWSVDNPNNNYWYSFLRATMTFALAAHDEDAYATECLGFVRDTLVTGELVPVLEELDGGGSREGTGYGVSMWHLFELYDLWASSTGEDLANLTGHARASLLHFFHEVVPTLDRVAPTGDHSRDSEANLFDYHRAYVAILAYLYQDDPLAARAQWFNAHSSVPEMDSPFMSVYDFLYEIDVAEQPLDGLNTAYHAPGIGEIYARSGWDTDATWLNVIAGPFTESHAHQDQGSFLLYKGEWLAYDPNVETASGVRFENELHNLVRITDGGETVPQHAPSTSEVVALAQGDGWFHVSVDSTGSYDGDERVESVRREVVYLEPDIVVIRDRVTSAAGTEQVWQLSSPITPAISGARATFAGASHTLRVERVTGPAVTTAARDWASLDDDFSDGHRYDETAAGGANTFVHVLWIDDAVTSVSESTGGATLTTPSGTVVVDFDSYGSTVEALPEML
jgi:hypothetical protein